MLWFLSLAISLIAALFAILVQQWLSEYPVRRATSVRQGVRLRQLRFDALHLWGVPDIINFLPVLLQIALVLFLAGLLMFLWSLNDVVARVITGFLAVPLTLLLSTALLPFVAASCPYKTTVTTFLLTFALSARALVTAAGAMFVFFVLFVCAFPYYILLSQTGITWSRRIFTRIVEGVFVSLVVVCTQAFSALSTRAEWINGDFTQAQILQTALDFAAVLWGPRALSHDDVSHLNRCLLDLSGADRTRCVLEWAIEAFNAPAKLGSAYTITMSPHALEDSLRRGTLQVDREVVDRLRDSLLDSLLPWENVEVAHLLETQTLTFLRHLVKLDPPPATTFVTRYQDLLLSMHTDLQYYHFQSSLSQTNDMIRIMIRSLLDLCVDRAIPMDVIGALQT